MVLWVDSKRRMVVYFSGFPRSGESAYVRKHTRAGYAENALLSGRLPA